MKHETSIQASSDDIYAPGDFVGFVTHRLGVDTMRRIEQAFGGLRISLGSSSKGQQALAKVIGAERAQIITQEFGTGAVDVPLGVASRSALIEQACLVGRTATDIAHSFRCCTRTVYGARARLRRQGRLK